MASSQAQDYDEVPYPSQAYSQMAPERISALAQLFGLRPAAVHQCRVLDLGCADGGHLLPLAERFPQSQFVGIDFSEQHIERAQQAAADLGLVNVQFLFRSIQEVGSSLGEFDYILAHGIFSWVPFDVQEALLALCRSQLSPQGLAYISYNLHPGWLLRGVIRELALGPLQSQGSVSERGQHASRLLRGASTALAQLNTPFAKLLKQEIDSVVERDFGYVTHEYLSRHNEAFYFHQFAERVWEHGLQYLGDATLSTMFVSNLEMPIANALLNLSADLIATEQYMDVLRYRAFRQSVVCRQEAPVSRDLSTSRLNGLYLAAQLVPEGAEADLHSTESVSFAAEARFSGSQVQGKISVAQPASKLAYAELGRAWPSAVFYDDLLVRVARRLYPNDPSAVLADADREVLGNNLLQMAVVGVLDLLSEPSRFATQVSRAPQASPLVRWQARSRNQVTSRTHQNIILDPMSHKLLPLLDGTRDRQTLLGEIAQAFERGELSVLVNGLPVGQGPGAAKILEQSLDSSLDLLSSLALLVE